MYNKTSFYIKYFLQCSVVISCLLSQTACQSPKKSHYQYFRYNQIGGLETLDPAFAKNLSIMWGVKFLYNTLFELDENLQLTPSLCQYYTVSPDGLEYTFNLRTDVYFHAHPLFHQPEGRVMTSHDVIYSLERLIDPQIASSGAWIFNGRLAEEQAFVYINDSTFKIRLKEAFAPFLEILTMPYCSIVPREVVEYYGPDFRNHPCGTGPFKFVHWEEGNTLILHKNEKYWEKDEAGIRLPYLEGVYVTFNEARSIELLMMLQGELDFINGVDGSVKDILLNKRGALRPELKDKMVLEKSTYLNAEFLGILMQGEEAEPLLQNKKLRQAINIGIDKSKLVTYYRNGVGIPAEAGMTPVGMLYPKGDSIPHTYPYNKSLARQWVLEVKDSLKINEIKLTLSTVEVMSDMCNFIANELKDIGVIVDIQIYQTSMLRQLMSQNKLSLFKAQWIADYPDPETYMAYFYSRFPSPPNYTRTHIPSYDRLYERALKELNDSMRHEIYKKMDIMIQEELPVIPLFYDEKLHFLQPNIQGFRSNALNVIDIKRVKKSSSPH